jgi:hypothetical protein
MYPSQLSGARTTPGVGDPTSVANDERVGNAETICGVADRQACCRAFCGSPSMSAPQRHREVVGRFVENLAGDLLKRPRDKCQQEQHEQMQLGRGAQGISASST